MVSGKLWVRGCLGLLLTGAALGQTPDPAPPARVMAFGIGQDRSPSLARTLALGQARSRLASLVLGEGFTWNRTEGRAVLGPGAEGSLEFVKTDRYLGLGSGKVLVLLSLPFPSVPSAGKRTFQVTLEASARDSGEAFEAVLADALAKLCRERLPEAIRARGRAYPFDLKVQAGSPAGKWRVTGRAWVLIDRVE